MSKKGLAILACFAAFILIAAAFTWYMNGMMLQPSQTPGAAANIHDYAKGLIEPKAGQPIKRFTLVAQESSLTIKDGLTIPVWTYNGTVPGPELRVQQGDFVQVELKNELKDPVTIHWHGYPLLSAMDGVPGVNQDSVRPGETFTYEFSADVAGTYWYHSHQEGAKQVDKGLYGALVVEPKDEPKPDRDFTLILDEWMENPMDEMGTMEGMGSMGMGSQGGNADPVMAEEEMMATGYNIYTVNGKSGYLLPPLEVKKGDTVRLRFVNAGYRSHGIHFSGQAFRVVSTDGQDIEGGSEIRNQLLMIAPGERYDVELKIIGEDDFTITSPDGSRYGNQIKIPVRVVDGSGVLHVEPAGEALPLFDLTLYGPHSNGKFSPYQKFDIEYKVELNTNTDNNQLSYTINGDVFSQLPPLKVKTGDTVKLTYENKSKVDHPMHLHGHFFEVLYKNGVAVSGAVITKDTLLVKPGEQYVVAFIADNTGRWVQHCHELHHAAAGMMQGIEYADYKPSYSADPNNKDNKPE